MSVLLIRSQANRFSRARFSQFLIAGVLATIAGFGIVGLSACSSNNPVVDLSQNTDGSSAPSPTAPAPVGQSEATDEITDEVADEGVRAERGERPTLTAEQEVALDPTGVLPDIIEIAGGDPTGAPLGATEMGNAVFCGFDIIRATGNGLEEDPEARACFIDGISRSVETVIVQALPLTETQETVHVYRFQPGVEAVVSYDYNGSWSERTCRGIEPTPQEGPNAFVLSECG